MTDNVLQSFCERCGTRFTQPAPPERPAQAPSVLGRFRRKAPEPAASSEAEALPISEAFRDTFRFCLECRRYNCSDCWNEREGHCLSCRPMDGTPERAGGSERVGAPSSVTPLTRPTSSPPIGQPAVAPVASRPSEGPGGWPTDDLVRAPGGAPSALPAAAAAPTWPGPGRDAAGTATNQPGPAWTAAATPGDAAGRVTGAANAEASNAVVAAEAEAAAPELDPWRGVVFTADDRGRTEASVEPFIPPGERTAPPPPEGRAGGSQDIGVLASLIGDDTHVDAASWARASSAVVGTGQLRSERPAEDAEDPANGEQVAPITAAAVDPLPALDDVPPAHLPLAEASGPVPAEGSAQPVSGMPDSAPAAAQDAVDAPDDAPHSAADVTVAMPAALPHPDARPAPMEQRSAPAAAPEGAADEGPPRVPPPASPSREEQPDVLPPVGRRGETDDLLAPLPETEAWLAIARRGLEDFSVGSTGLPADPDDLGPDWDGEGAGAGSGAWAAPERAGAGSAWPGTSDGTATMPQVGQGSPAAVGQAAGPQPVAGTPPPSAARAGQPGWPVDAPTGRPPLVEAAPASIAPTVPPVLPPHVAAPPEPAIAVWVTHPEPGPFQQPYQPSPPQTAVQPAPVQPSATGFPGGSAPAAPGSLPPGVPASPLPPVALPGRLPADPGPVPPPAVASTLTPPPSTPGPPPPPGLASARASSTPPFPAAIEGALPPPVMPPPARPPAAAARPAVRPAAGSHACPNCALPISTKARFCRRCGAPQPA